MEIVLTGDRSCPEQQFAEDGWVTIYAEGHPTGRTGAPSSVSKSCRFSTGDHGDHTNQYVPFKLKFGES